MLAPADVTVVHQPEAGRFVLRRVVPAADGDTAGEEIGYLAYTDVGDRVDVYTTQIRPEFRDQGMAAILVEAALVELGSEPVTIIPSCWYVRDFINENIRFRHLLGPPGV